MGEVAARLNEDLAHLQMPLPSRVEKRGLLCDLVDVIGVHCIVIILTFFFDEFMYNVESIFLSGVVEGSLSVDILIVEVESLIEQQIQALLLALPADIEEDGLLVIILEVGICAMLNQQLHEFVGLLVIDEYGSEVEGRLPGLRLQPVDDDRVVLSQEAVDDIHCAE